MEKGASRWPFSRESVEIRYRLLNWSTGISHRQRRERQILQKYECPWYWHLSQRLQQLSATEHSTTLNTRDASCCATRIVRCGSSHLDLDRSQNLLVEEICLIVPKSAAQIQLVSCSSSTNLVPCQSSSAGKGSEEKRIS